MHNSTRLRSFVAWSLAGCALTTVSLAGSNTGERGESIAEFSPDESKRLSWQVVNDGVMGGLSNGNIEISDDGKMRFSGKLSLKNNGGFTTFRSSDLELDLGRDQGLVLLVKGDGRTYEARLATDERFRSGEISFTGDFKTTKGKWEEVKIPFSDFKASFRGMSLRDRTLDPSKIRRVGILLGDKKEGPFELEIDWIRSYGSDGASDSLTSGGKDSKPDSKAKKEGAGNLVETVVADGRFKTLATALTEAELLDVLSGNEALTVFAPTDEAFAKLPKKVLADLLKPENREQLIAVLTYHVTPGASGLGDALKAAEIATVQGDKVEVAFSEGLIRVNDATLVDSDVRASNGVIHVIDSVLLPPKPLEPTIATVAADAGNFGTLLAAVKAAGLAETLAGDGPFTVFAPTDEAFGKLPKGTVETLLKEENRDQLVAILTAHVVAGKVSAGDALNAGVAKSLGGSELRFGVKKGQLQVNEATIQSVDIDGGNGVIHVIDAVIIPQERKEEDLQTRSSDEAAGKSKTAQGGARRLDASRSIVSAIEKGVPLYNGGDAGACATVYRDCLAELAENEGIDSRAREMLSRVVMNGEKHRGAVDRAWFYRRALDGMMAYLQREAN